MVIKNKDIISKMIDMEYWYMYIYIIFKHTNTYAYFLIESSLQWT